MTVKPNYSKLFPFIASIIVTSLFCCKNLKTDTSITAPKNVAFDTVFFGYANKGTHARAIDVAPNFVAVAGKGGVVTIISKDTVVPQVIRSKTFDGFEDFRDMKMVEGGAALFMNSGENGLIYGVAPGGGTGMIVYDTAGVFFDGMDYADNDPNFAILFGDPVGDKFFLAKTENMGRNWTPITPETMPNSLSGEAGFAASGTGIQVVGDSTVYFGTGGGKTARVFKSTDRGSNWKALETPMRAGEGFGIYSLYFWNEDEGVVIGGNYLDSTYNEKICFYTQDGGESWDNRSFGLGGYCSVIASSEDGSMTIASGRMGTFYSVDKGKNWSKLTNRAYYTCMIENNSIYLSGRSGTYAVFRYQIQDE
ncbi:MAG: hypothetical protein ACPG21_01045 [Crocinitomicaceae bacterium]